MTKEERRPPGALPGNPPAVEHSRGGTVDAGALAAEFDRIESAEVPEIVADAFTPEEWRQLLAIEALAWYMPVGEENVRRYNDLYAKFDDAVNRRTVRKLERKLAGDENLDFAEGQVWAAAVEKSRAELPTDADRAWDEWYAKPISESLFPTFVAPMARALHARTRGRAPRGRRHVRRVGASRASPTARDDDEPPHGDVAAGGAE